MNIQTCTINIKSNTDKEVTDYDQAQDLMYGFDISGELYCQLCNCRHNWNEECQHDL